MRSKTGIARAVPFAGVILSACVFWQSDRLLHAPTAMSVNRAAAGHNEQGVTAYEQGRWQEAKEHFEAAVQASPVLAEAHYNLGMVLSKMGAEQEAYPHFMKAANLEPGNDAIMNAPPLRGVQKPSGGGAGPAFSSDGHGHVH